MSAFTVELHGPTAHVEEAKNRRIEGEQGTPYRLAPVRQPVSRQRRPRHALRASGSQAGGAGAECSFESSNLRIFDLTVGTFQLDSE